MGTPGRRQPRHRQGRVGRQDAAAADRRRARHGGQPRVQRRGQRLVQGVRRNNGKELWRFNAGAGVNAPAVSYMVNGKQYVAVAAGGNNQIDAKRGNSVFVFALP